MVVAAEGTWWREARYIEGTENLWDVAAGATNWVFVGADSGAPVIYTVPAANITDLVPTFTARSASGSDPLKAVGWSNTANVFCAAGNNGRVEISTNNGVSWSGSTLSGSPNFWGVGVFAAGVGTQFLAVGNGAIWGRDNGGVWTSRWTGAEIWRSAAHKVFVGFVVVGDGGKMTYSADGSAGSFVAPFVVGSGKFFAVAAGWGYFIAVGEGGQAYRSVTGASGTWSAINIPTTNDLQEVAPLRAGNSWGAITIGGKSFYSTDNGVTWTDNPVLARGTVVGLDSYPSGGAAAVGTKGGVYVSIDQTQDDPPAEVAAPEVEPAYSANDDMAKESVRRLVTQFRSGDG